MTALLREDAPLLFGFHPKAFSLQHAWVGNVKPNLMANNTLKYRRIDAELRSRSRAQWNRPVFWPLALAVAMLAAMVWPAWRQYRKHEESRA